jgi:hypothetical protein
VNTIVLTGPILRDIAEEKMFDKVEKNQVMDMIEPSFPWGMWNFSFMKYVIRELKGQ